MRPSSAVLGGDVVGMLNMPSAEAVIGDHIRIMGVQFEVVGVLKSRGNQGNSSEEFLKTLSETSQTFTTLLAGIASVSLLVGGLVGAVAGMGSALIMHRTFGWNTVVGPDAILLAFAFSGTVGVLFGVWPA